MRKRKGVISRAALARQVKDLEAAVQAARAGYDEEERERRRAEAKAGELEKTVAALRFELRGKDTGITRILGQRDKLAGYIEGHRAFTSPNLPNVDENGMYRETWLDRFLAENTADVWPQRDSDGEMHEIWRRQYNARR